MKKNVVADTSFFICNACTLKRCDLLLQYLDLYQFHAGKNIMDEIPHMEPCDKEIRSKIKSINVNANYIELFKPISTRNSDHIENDGEYEAIGIAIELSLTKEGLHCLILDDKKAKNFASSKFPQLHGKIHGTIGFIYNSYKEDRLISKPQCLYHLKAIYQAYVEHKKDGILERPCAMDENSVNKHLLPLIKKVENNNEGL